MFLFQLHLYQNHIIGITKLELFIIYSANYFLTRDVTHIVINLQQAKKKDSAEIQNETLQYTVIIVTVCLTLATLNLNVLFKMSCRIAFLFKHILKSYSIKFI